MTPVKIAARQLTYPFARPFRIASQTYNEATVVEVMVELDGIVGRGEAAGVDYCGENCETMLAQIAELSARCDPNLSLDRGWLQHALPPGGARNALDCALWDIDAKRAGVRASDLAGQPCDPVNTFISIGLDMPDVMADDARAFSSNALIKIKLGHHGDRDCLRAVRAAAPDARLIVDANQAWTFAQFLAFEDELLGNDVLLVEQPLPANNDERLIDYRGPLLLVADESCHDRTSLAALTSKYDFINIKLDKAGGLTEALALADEASAMGFRLMVGCMGGSSLGIAPALIVAQRCEIVDLDCPLQLQKDIAHGLCFQGHSVEAPSSILWG